MSARSQLRDWPTIFLLLIAWTLWTPRNAFAHRLDECLQAARFAVGEARVEIELDLTPGAEMAARFLALIDLDRNGQFSAAEGEAFADRVKNSVTVKLDGTAKPLVAAVEELPTSEGIKAGTGIIRLRLTTEHAALLPGLHRLTFHNRHQPETSVYLANALVPESKRIQVIRQHRDPTQRDYELEFSVK